jgi:hypothetical protein
VTHHEIHSLTTEGAGAHRAPAPVRGGRPRSPSADRVILEVATRILQDEGYRSLNIGRSLRNRALPRPRFTAGTDRRDLAAAAVGALLEAHGAFQAPDTGSCRDDIKLVFSALRSAESSPLLSVLGAVLSEGRRDSELMERMWIRAFDPHHRARAAILERGVERGEPPGSGIATTIEMQWAPAACHPGHPWTTTGPSRCCTVWVGIRRGRETSVAWVVMETARRGGLLTRRSKVDVNCARGPRPGLQAGRVQPVLRFVSGNQDASKKARLRRSCPFGCR